jgi:hypothetical protein
MRYERNTYEIFNGKPEGKNQLAKLICMWEDKIGIYPVEIGSLVVD